MEQNQKDTELSEEEKKNVEDAPQTEEAEKTGPDGAKSERPAEPEEDGGVQISEEQKKKIICALAYVFGILFFLPLVCYPNDRFAKFHANQSLAIFLIVVVGEVLFGILAGIAGLGVVFGIVLAVFNVAVLLACIYAILGVVKGEERGIPLIKLLKILK